jgi:hypothetical protein
MRARLDAGEGGSRWRALQPGIHPPMERAQLWGRPGRGGGGSTHLQLVLTEHGQPEPRVRPQQALRGVGHDLPPGRPLVGRGRVVRHHRHQRNGRAAADVAAAAAAAAACAPRRRRCRAQRATPPGAARPAQRQGGRPQHHPRLPQGPGAQG